MITIDDQLKNKANSLDKKGNLYLYRCMACPGYHKNGRENYMLCIATGTCAWCKWPLDNRK